MASPQPVVAPQPEERVETARPLPKPEKKETPFVFKAVSVIPA
jgi:hypothetical protein